AGAYRLWEGAFYSDLLCAVEEIDCNARDIEPPQNAEPVSLIEADEPLAGLSAIENEGSKD
ncbi:MAG TPA: hypothetical protein VN151_06680, partial [Terracidiphilus sp.]|nr:hypothetical protein [Terracidiphilus sp.]